MKRMRPGDRLVLVLETPILEDFWTVDHSDEEGRLLFDYERAKAVEDRLSTGERELVNIARSIAGHGAVHLFQSLAFIDGPSRDRVVDEIRRLVDRMSR